MNKKNEYNCECNAIKTLAADENCPIQLDETLGEYNFISNDGTVYYRMYYCFFCGGLLPRSKRLDLYDEPDENEVDQVKKLLDKAHTIQDVLKTLGEPDHDIAPPGEQEAGNILGKHYYYSSAGRRWTLRFVAAPTICSTLVLWARSGRTRTISSCRFGPFGPAAGLSGQAL